MAKIWVPARAPRARPAAAAPRRPRAPPPRPARPPPGPAPPRPPRPRRRPPRRPPPAARPPGRAKSACARASWSALRSAGAMHSPSCICSVKAFERSQSWVRGRPGRQRPAARARGHSEPRPASRRRRLERGPVRPAKAISAAGTGAPAGSGRLLTVAMRTDRKTPSPQQPIAAAMRRHQAIVSTMATHARPSAPRATHLHTPEALARLKPRPSAASFARCGTQGEAGDDPAPRGMQGIEGEGDRSPGLAPRRQPKRHGDQHPEDRPGSGSSGYRG